MAFLESFTDDDRDTYTVDNRCGVVTIETTCNTSDNRRVDIYPKGVGKLIDLIRRAADDCHKKEEDGVAEEDSFTDDSGDEYIVETLDPDVIKVSRCDYEEELRFFAKDAERLTEIIRRVARRELQRIEDEKKKPVHFDDGEGYQVEVKATDGMLFVKSRHGHVGVTKESARQLIDAIRKVADTA